MVGTDVEEGWSLGAFVHYRGAAVSEAAAGFRGAAGGDADGCGLGGAAPAVFGLETKVTAPTRASTTPTASSRRCLELMSST